MSIAFKPLCCNGISVKWSHNKPFRMGLLVSTVYHWRWRLEIWMQYTRSNMPNALQDTDTIPMIELFLQKKILFDTKQLVRTWYSKSLFNSKEFVWCDLREKRDLVLASETDTAVTNRSTERSQTFPFILKFSFGSFRSKWVYVDLYVNPRHDWECLQNILAYIRIQRRALQ